MGNPRDGVTVYRAWGYYTAAMRGEIEPYVSQRRVEAWIDTRPWAEQVRANVVGEANYLKWRREMAGRMVAWLEKFAVREEGGEPWFFGAG